MRKPLIPPNLKNSDFKRFISFQRDLSHLPISPVYKGEYLHWDELRNKQPRPKEVKTAEEWWFSIKLARKYLQSNELPFIDTNGKAFHFICPNNLLPKLAKIDRKSGGPIPDFNAHNQNQYLVRSLIEEAISSSQLEGASTTRRIAKEMLLSQRKPRTESEKMIFNNYRAMQFIRENKERRLSVDFILDIHRILTENILEDAGRIRRGDDIHVVDELGEILHTPPPASELKERLKSLCLFANTDETEEEHYIHPVIKAILLHFALAYDHPFSDGNGRTARALFYWFMLNRGYWLIEYISISQIIKQSHAQYAKAFLYTETDENDVTYFIFHQLKIILKAIDALFLYIDKKTHEIRKVEELLHHNQSLNHRQLAIIQHAMKHPSAHYLIENHRQSHNVTYQTARTDLLKLVNLGLLLNQKAGKAFVFVVPFDLGKKIEKLKKQIS